VTASPWMLKDPEELPHTIVKDQTIYPACTVTRVMARQKCVEESNSGETMSQKVDILSDSRETSISERKAIDPLNLAETFVGKGGETMSR